MNGNEKRKYMSLGLWLDGSLFFGEAMTEVRAKMKAAGAGFDGKQCRWIFPTREMMESFRPKPKPVPVSDGLPPVDMVSVPAAPLPPVKPTVAPKGPAVLQSVPAPSLPPVEIPKPVSRVARPPNTQPPRSSEVSQKTPEAPPKPEMPKPNGRSVQVGTWSRSSLMKLPAALIVTQSVQRKGAVEYFTEDEDRQYVDENGVITSTTRKTTQKVITDEEEYVKTRQLADTMRRRVRDLGVVTQAGVIRVRKARQEELDKIMDEIEGEALEHNRTARYHFIRLLISYEETSSESVKYAQQYAYLLQEQMDKIRLAIEACDVKKIRDEATAFKKLAEGANESDSALILKTVNEARQIAKFVDKEVNRKSRQIAEVKERINTQAIDAARMKFLSYEAPPAMEAARASIDKSRYSDLSSEVKPMVVNGSTDSGRYRNDQ